MGYSKQITKLTPVRAKDGFNLSLLAYCLLIYDLLYITIDLFLFICGILIEPRLEACSSCLYEYDYVAWSYILSPSPNYKHLKAENLACATYCSQYVESIVSLEVCKVITFSWPGSSGHSREVEPESVPVSRTPDQLMGISPGCPLREHSLIQLSSWAYTTQSENRET